MVDVAGPADATVNLLHVFPHAEYEDLLEQMGTDPTTSRLQPGELAARNDDVRVPAARLDELGLSYEIHGTVGDPESEVVRIAEDLRTDLVFIGGKGRSPAGKAVFGDRSQKILLNAPCPVTYVKRD